MIKVRLQLAGAGGKTGSKPSALSVTREILKTGKVLDLYTGLSAGLLRQAVYTTARLGIFDTLMGRLGSRAEKVGKKVGFAERAGAGLTAGGLAAMVGMVFPVFLRPYISSESGLAGVKVAGCWVPTCDPVPFQFGCEKHITGCTKS